MGFQFQHPEFVLGLMVLPLLILLFWYVLRWKKTTTAKIGDERLVKELIGQSFSLQIRIEIWSWHVSSCSGDHCNDQPHTIGQQWIKWKGKVLT